MMLSVFRQNKPTMQMDYAVVLSVVSNENDLNLVGLALRTNHAVLIGMDNDPTIVKPVAAGDEDLSFVALYDTCYTLTDLQRMQRRGVDSPADAVLDTFRLDLEIPLEGTVIVSVNLRAENPGNARAVLRDLIRHDNLFGNSLKEAMLRAVARHLDPQFRIRETESNQPDLNADDAWRVFLPEDEDDDC